MEFQTKNLTAKTVFPQISIEPNWHKYFESENISIIVEQMSWTLIKKQILLTNSLNLRL